MPGSQRPVGRVSAVCLKCMKPSEKTKKDCFDDMLVLCLDLFRQKTRYFGEMAEEVSVYFGR